MLGLRLRSRSSLLTGDLEREAERSLVSAGDDLTGDVVKVAHHGSRTSSSEAFIRATGGPALAVVSVGLDSPFGHPHGEVVGRWRAAGARVLTTGECGTITVSTDGRDLSVESFVGGRPSPVSSGR